MQVGFSALSETDPSVWGGADRSYGERGDPVPLHSLCQTEAGPVPRQLLPRGKLLGMRGSVLSNDSFISLSDLWKKEIGGCLKGRFDVYSS